jgi:hypothetical protein
MFAKARKSSMDLDELGQRLKARKEQLGNGDNVALRGIGKSVLDA